MGQHDRPRRGTRDLRQTALDARIDPGQEKSQVAATLSRTLPLNGNVSVTLQDKYSLTQTLPGNSRGRAALERRGVASRPFATP